MGAGSSKQRLGGRVETAIKKLEAVKKIQSERTARIKAASPETLEVIVRNITDSFERCSPFSEALLMVAVEANPEEILRVVSKSVKKVLSAPVAKDEYAWFEQYVFPSMVWMMQSKDGSFLYEAMMKITRSMSEKIDNAMHSIFDHLQTHTEWNKLAAIENVTNVERQDDDRVGLLQDQGIREVGDAKDDEQEELSTFIDSNLAVNVLTTTAKKINAEFQGRVKAVMSRFGEFRAGPIKSVERCQSKMEND